MLLVCKLRHRDLYHGKDAAPARIETPWPLGCLPT